MIPSSVNVGEIGRILKEGYDVGRLNDGFQRVVQDLRLDYLFIDTHPGVNEETLLSIAISDKLMLVMRPDSQDFQGTAVTAELARRLEIPEMFIVVNKVPPGMDTAQLRERVEKAYGAEVAAMLPMNYRNRPAGQQRHICQPPSRSSDDARAEASGRASDGVIRRNG